jgi:hypothetical protein
LSWRTVIVIGIRSTVFVFGLRQICFMSALPSRRTSELVLHCDAVDSVRRLVTRNFVCVGDVNGKRVQSLHWIVQRRSASCSNSWSRRLLGIVLGAVGLQARLLAFSSKPHVDMVTL